VVLAPSGAGEEVGLAVRCPVCGSTSINLVTTQHLDVPFHNDREVGVVPHVFTSDFERVVEEFATELYSARFDSRRLAL
jgi:hypothetical protein